MKKKKTCCWRGTLPPKHTCLTTGGGLLGVTTLAETGVGKLLEVRTNGRREAE